MDFTILVLAILAAAWVFSISRALISARNAYKTRVELLREYERDAAKFGSWEEFQRIASKRLETGSSGSTVDFRLTGVMLFTLGAVCVGWGYWQGYGQWAVAAYIGGIVAAATGILVACFGAILRIVTQQRPLETPRD